MTDNGNETTSPVPTQRRTSVAVGGIEKKRVHLPPRTQLSIGGIGQLIARPFFVNCAQIFPGANSIGQQSTLPGSIVSPANTGELAQNAPTTIAKIIKNNFFIFISFQKSFWFTEIQISSDNYFKLGIPQTIFE
ncbi:hypothetical protein KAI54_04135 [Candidatus Gracilibacteria bacterium]|nr:hypothetical protein [Candidatus Gracilibacteria bacterium]